MAGISDFIAGDWDYREVQFIPNHPHPLPTSFLNPTIMPDTSSAATQTVSSGDITSIHQELEGAEKTADVVEGRLSTLEKHLDEMLDKLGKEDSATQTEST